MIKKRSILFLLLFFISSVNFDSAQSTGNNSDRNPSNNGIACTSSQATKASSGNSRAQTCTFLISLNPVGGTVNPTSINYLVGSGSIYLPIPIRNNFSFNGWFTSQIGGIQIRSPYTPTGSMVLYAQWTQKVQTYNVGDLGPGGGIIYYVSPTAFTSNGSLCSSACHYLEVAPVGWSGTPIDPLLQFSIPEFQNSYVAATGIDIGTGFTNTQVLIAQNGACSLISVCQYAAGAASAYQGGSKSDWFLPSPAESHLLAIANYELIILRSILGLQTPGDGYWNSWAGNPDAPNAATDTVFTLQPDTNNGYEGGYKSKSTLYFVRPIRAF